MLDGWLKLEAEAERQAVRLMLRLRLGMGLELGPWLMLGSKFGTLASVQALAGAWAAVAAGARLE